MRSTSAKRDRGDAEQGTGAAETQAPILCPTRELAQQIHVECRRLLWLPVAVYDGAAICEQIKLVWCGCDVMIHSVRLQIDGVAAPAATRPRLTAWARSGKGRAAVLVSRKRTACRTTTRTTCTAWAGRGAPASAA